MGKTNRSRLNISLLNQLMYSTKNPNVKNEPHLTSELTPRKDENYIWNQIYGLISGLFSLNLLIFS